MIKQTVYVPLVDLKKDKHSDVWMVSKNESVGLVKKEEAFVFTTEQYNSNLEDIVYYVLKIAVEEAKINFWIDEETNIVQQATINKQSILGAFDKIYETLKQ